jgi:UDP-N-acetylmuramoyl-tripeptide--D-alanyl-D-alanine ligase
VSIATPLGVKEVESKLWGEQNVNAMAVALAVGLEMGVGFDEIASSLRHMRSPRGRGALLQSKEGILFIDESYNASPVSVKAAINNLKAMPWRGRKVAVLGGMRELGGCEKQFHEEVLGVVTSVADIAVLYGQEWDGLHANSTKTVLLFEEIEEVSSYLKDILLSGDVVLVKGSRFYEMERIYDRWSLDEL